MMCQSARRLVLVILGLASAGSSQSARPGQLVGVWKAVEFEIGGANPPTHTKPQPNLLIITPMYYSWVEVSGAEPRSVVEPAKDPGRLTDAEKLARYQHWRLFVANAGTYEVSGAKLIWRPIVAKTATTIEQSLVREFKIEGDTLWLAGGGIGFDAAGATRARFVRLE
jgi:hypothetical protein